MQAARRDVGCDQHFDLATLEFSKQALALFLRDVAGQHSDQEALALEAPRDFLGGNLHVDEDHAALGVGARQKADQQRNLFLTRREIDQLAHAIGRDEFGFDGELLGLVHVFVGQLQNAMAQGGREQQALAARAFGQAAQDEAHVRDEAQVEHAVGFVQDQTSRRGARTRAA